MTAPQKNKLHERPELLQERVHDTYRRRGAPKGPLVCDACGAVFEAGRWQWIDAPKGAEHGTCPACQRIADRYPAGIVDCSGSFAASHLGELRNIASNVEHHERGRHPLERIISIVECDGRLVIETTGPHLARRIAKAVHSALDGELELEQPPGEYFVRAHWHRDA